MRAMLDPVYRIHLGCCFLLLLVLCYPFHSKHTSQANHPFKSKESPLITPWAWWWIFSISPISPTYCFESWVLFVAVHFIFDMQIIVSENVVVCYRFPSILHFPSTYTYMEGLVAKLVVSQSSYLYKNIYIVVEIKRKKSHQSHKTPRFLFLLRNSWNTM